jgi:GNAT superfamily N-acetyltransferase
MKATVIPAGPDSLRDFAFSVTCVDGTRYRVRPIRPDDAPGLAAFHRRLSFQSVYYRFFSCHPELSAREIERFTCVDYVDRLALVAERNGDLIAVGRYDRMPETAEAEVAFVVADDYQRHGVGSLLLDELARAAWRCGVRTFAASTLAENKTMLKVFFHSGFHVSSHRDSETISLEFSIEPDDQYKSVLCAREWTRTRCYADLITTPVALAM